MGAYVAGMSLATLVSETYSTRYPELVAASWQPVRDRLLLHLWTEGNAFARDVAVSAGALCTLWIIGRGPVVSLSIQRYDPMDDDYE